MVHITFDYDRGLTDPSITREILLRICSNENKYEMIFEVCLFYSGLSAFGLVSDKPTLVL